MVAPAARAHLVEVSAAAVRVSKNETDFELSMTVIGVGAVVGYAVGTIQVLFVDWWRRIAAHRRQMLLLQADLRRLRGFDKQFGWNSGKPPDDDMIPMCPGASELFARTVSECDWRLSDEHEDDNSQQAFLNLLDGIALLRMSHAKAIEHLDLARAAIGDVKNDLVYRAIGYAGQYDDVLDQVLYQIDDSLREIARRLPLAVAGEQVNRAFGMLPPGVPPKSFDASDPRFLAWKKRYRRGAS